MSKYNTICSFEKNEFGHTDNENLLLIAQIAKTGSVTETENRSK